LRDDVQKLREVTLPTANGAQIPLGQVAEVRVLQGPMAVKTENAFPVTTVLVDIDRSDVGGYVRRAQQVVARQLRLPPGYTLVWSGQFEFMQRVRERLHLVIPVTLGIILLLLYLNFRGLAESLIVMLTLPFGLIGGVWSLWLAGYNTSVAAWVGFIALAGVAAETGVVMLLYLDEAFERRQRQGELRSMADLASAVTEGAVGRLRPKMMTVVAIMAGLAPILWSTGTGADVMKRIAAPMVGGMISSTILTLVVIPAIYLLWRRRALSAAAPAP
jgi:Cu(I)/Ag(I) efflux system membrane protein CusA/SilA